ncbi:MAG: iron-containing alcohol dehydrogenase [Moraxellaceae bacterium]|nr:iron-containing alcohol dehydrogenase [Moraxellaceae bacterium]HQV40412.1 iron-containing alcohol dehydrogenase [Moraxellaceae bacterium]HQX89203.1 iron-containing alcohol dehydrogenase [Moraxellaceae bacterium]
MSRFSTILKAKAKLAAVRVAVTVIPAPRPIVLLGEGAALNLCNTVSHIGVKRVLIVTDAILVKLGVVEPVLNKLAALGIETVVFSGVTPDPTITVVNEGLAMLRMGHCDAVLAVGGGSSIDAAKVIALSATNNKTPRELIGILKGRKPSLPLFVIPTTAGTGSEVTIGAVVSDDQTHQKGLVIDPRVVPLATAIDPVVMQGMPKAVTADTGIDALTHALESWMSEIATDDTDYFASAAVRMVLTHLPVAFNDGKNLDARVAMGLAAHYGGMALNKAGLGYVHAIAHQLGAHYGVPHGRSNAIVLPYILEFNRDACSERLAELARKVGIATPDTSDRIAADQLITQVKQLLKDVNINTRIPDMNPADFPAMVVSAFAEAHGTYAVARYMDPKDVTNILHEIARG